MVQSKTKKGVLTNNTPFYLEICSDFLFYFTFATTALNASG